MPCADDAPRLVGEDRIHLFGHGRRIAVFRQLVGFADAEQRLPLDVRANDDGARHWPKIRRQGARHPRLAGTGEPANRDQPRGWRIYCASREIKIGAHRLRNVRLLCRCHALHPRAGDFGADRSAHRQEKRHRGQRIEVFGTPGFDKVAVEHDIRRYRQPALQQIHQQERQIVEDVARSNHVTEFNGVEQHRLAVDQCNVAEMKIAMDAADQAVGAAHLKKRQDAIVSATASAAEIFDFRSVEDVWMLPKRLHMLVDIVVECCDPSRRIGRLCPRMRSGHDAPERIGEVLVDPPGEAVKRARLVEAAHFHRPFDRLHRHRRSPAVRRPRG